MKIIEKVHIEKFRGFENVDISFNHPVNAIIGKNGTLKTTLLGILAHPFSLETGKMSEEQPLIGGKKFNSRMSDKFKFSDIYDRPGEHKWTLTINPIIYAKREYTCLSELRTDNKKIRFWSTEGREKGMNYIQCPVIYLSMKRLLPIGEEKRISVKTTTLTDEEKDLYFKWHNQILISSDILNDVSNIISVNKFTLGPETSFSDAITISAGQDNVGRIILAVLSMKRLKEKYDDEYKGGIIFIDEIESTLYPAAQEKLVEFMYETAYNSKLQYFFTTHSMSTITFLKTGKYHERSKLIYLQKIANKIKVTEDPTLKDIENNLNVAAGRKGSGVKLKVYCEDSVGIMFTKAFLPSNIKAQIEFVNGMDLSWTTYKTLYDHKVPEFLNNIIILDGDVRKQDTGWRKYPKNKNILFLPTLMAPERMIYETLYNLDQDDNFWDNTLSGYSKEVCFRNFPNHIDDIDSIKEWFNEQKLYAGKAYQKFIKVWKKNHQDEIKIFVEDFIKAYNYVAKRVGSKLIKVE